MDLKRAMQNWNLKYVDVARSPESVLRMFTNSERLANQMKIKEIGKVEQLVQKIEMGDPKAGKLVRKMEMGDPKVGKIGEVAKLVKKIQMNEPQVGKVWKSVKFGQEEYTKPEEDAMLARVGEESLLLKCFDDITGKELPWQAVKQAREKELKYLRELGVYEEANERTAVSKYNVTPVDTKWVDTGKAFEEEPMQIRPRLVAREFKN